MYCQATSFWVRSVKYFFICSVCNLYMTRTEVPCQQKPVPQNGCWFLRWLCLCSGERGPSRLPIVLPFTRYIPKYQWSNNIFYQQFHGVVWKIKIEFHMSLFFFANVATKTNGRITKKTDFFWFLGKYILLIKIDLAVYQIIVIYK